MLNIQAIWDQYLQRGGKACPTDFGVYLIRNGDLPDGLGNIPDDKLSESLTEVEHKPFTSNSVKAGMLVGRLERFLFLQAKPRLKKAGLHNFDDFGLLATLFFKQNITKGQLLKQSLVEPATGTEMIKRMKKAGWILEEPNPKDGRSVMVTLSLMGQQLLQACFQQLDGLNDILDALTPEEQFEIVNMLERLDDCHSKKLGVQSILDWMQQANLFLAK